MTIQFRLAGGNRPALLAAALLGMVALTACSSTEDASGTAGRMGPLSMRGSSYRDSNDSRRRDADEPPLGGVRVTLLRDESGKGSCDKEVVSMTTGDDGAFAFESLTPGSYCVSASTSGLKVTSYAADGSPAGDQSAPMAVDERSEVTVDIGMN